MTLPKWRALRWTALVAVGMHAGVLALLLWGRDRALTAWQPVVALGEARAERGGGGGGIRDVALPPYREQAAPPVPPAVPKAGALVPAPVLPAEPPPVAVPDPQADSVAAGPTVGEMVPGSGGGSGGGAGGGHGTGVGPGTGPGAGPGEGGGGGRAAPPEPRQLILPPLDYPRQMRGRTIEVTFWVGVDGRVERVALGPEIEDRGFARKFLDVMRQYRFRPARAANGTVIAGTTTVRVTF